MGIGKRKSGGSLTVAGLFAGIGGIELGLHRAGHETALLCEIDDSATAVLRSRFPEIRIVPDVRSIKRLPRVDLVAAGFPCQDLSQAGRTAGIRGRNSGLVGEVFRLLDDAPRSLRWLLLENVPFMLQLDRGKGMRFLTESLEKRGYRWAYRVVDTRSFGLPQRRQRVFMLASRSEDPRAVLFADDAETPAQVEANGHACGFYWTEGTRGLGWAVDAVPTLKGGSTVGIPSPPGIWMPDGEIVVPEIRDAERLQGFPSDWTKPAQLGNGRKGPRWKLVGNAVSVPVAEWVGRRLASPGAYDVSRDEVVEPNQPWPTAAWGEDGRTYRANVSMWPVRRRYHHLLEFLRYPTPPLSERATAGFYSRASQSNLRFPAGFLSAIDAHLTRVRRKSA
ncbi:MAG: DNA (cytosine-5-)-methyltransferase [Actinomycetota bacterium]|nr:DNA (cytosine-5-)-methyltransferase [Actinomycetota bacterium]